MFELILRVNEGLRIVQKSDQQEAQEVVDEAELDRFVEEEEKTDKIISAGRLILNIFVISNLISFSIYYTVTDFMHSKESLK